MKIAAVTNIKWGALFQALQQADWTAADLSRRTGIGQSQLGLFLNLRSRPSEESVRKIENAFLLAGVDVDLTLEWPKEFKGFGKRGKTPTLVQIKDIAADLLITYDPQPTPLQLVEAADDAQAALRAVANLKPRLQRVLNLRFGFNGEEDHTLEETAQVIGVSRERVRQMEARALRELRHPSNNWEMRGRTVAEHLKSIEDKKRREREHRIHEANELRRNYYIRKKLGLI